MLVNITLNFAILIYLNLLICYIFFIKYQVTKKKIYNIFFMISHVGFILNSFIEVYKFCAIWAYLTPNQHFEIKFVLLSSGIISILLFTPLIKYLKKK